jgi:hypothetical protein
MEETPRNIDDDDVHSPINENDKNQQPIAYLKDNDERIIPLRIGRNVIGRKVTPSSSIEAIDIDDNQLSKQHVAIEIEKNEMAFVEDLNSRNKTRLIKQQHLTLKTQKIILKPNRLYQITHDDVLMLGSLAVTFILASMCHNSPNSIEKMVVCETPMHIIERSHGQNNRQNATRRLQSEDFATPHKPEYSSSNGPPRILVPATPAPPNTVVSKSSDSIPSGPLVGESPMETPETVLRRTSTSSRDSVSSDKTRKILLFATPMKSHVSESPLSDRDEDMIDFVPPAINFDALDTKNDTDMNDNMVDDDADTDIEDNEELPASRSRASIVLETLDVLSQTESSSTPNILADSDPLPPSAPPETTTNNDPTDFDTCSDLDANSNMIETIETSDIPSAEHNSTVTAELSPKQTNLSDPVVTKTPSQPELTGWRIRKERKSIKPGTEIITEESPELTVPVINNSSEPIVSSASKVSDPLAKEQVVLLQEQQKPVSNIAVEQQEPKQEPQKQSTSSDLEFDDKDEDNTQSQPSQQKASRSKKKRNTRTIITSDDESPPKKTTKRKRSSTPDIVEEETPSESESQKRKKSRRNQPTKIFFTGMSHEGAPYKNTIKTLGGTLVEKDVIEELMNGHMTHLVTDKIRRTVKFLCALGKAQHIVSIDWIDQSKKSKQFLSESEFILRDRDSETKFGTTLAESFQRRRELEEDNKLVFTGKYFFVTPSVKPPPSEMKQIIECNGGSYLNTLTTLKSHLNDDDDEDQETNDISIIVVTCADDEDYCIDKVLPLYMKKYSGDASDYYKHFFTNEIVLTTVMRQQLSLDENLFQFDTTSSQQTSRSSTRSRRRKK